MSVELRDCVRSGAFMGLNMLPAAVLLKSCATALAGVAPLEGLSTMFCITPIRFPSTPWVPIGCGTVGLCLLFSAGLVLNPPGRASNVGIVRVTALGE